MSFSLKVLSQRPYLAPGNTREAVRHVKDMGYEGSLLAYICTDAAHWHGNGAEQAASRSWSNAEEPGHGQGVSACILAEFIRAFEVRYRVKSLNTRATEILHTRTGKQGEQSGGSCADEMGAQI